MTPIFQGRSGTYATSALRTGQVAPLACRGGFILPVWRWFILAGPALARSFGIPRLTDRPKSKSCLGTFPARQSALCAVCAFRPPVFVLARGARAVYRNKFLATIAHIVAVHLLMRADWRTDELLVVCC